MPSIFSNAAENLSARSRIFGGCSDNVVNIRGNSSGLSLINSAAATINARSPLMSCRIVDKCLFNSSICAGDNVTAVVGKPIPKKC